MYKYSLEHGSWYLKDEQGNIILMTDYLVMLYDAETFTLHKSGDMLAVAKYEKILREAGFPMNTLLLSKGTPVEEVNKMISITGYIKYFIEKYTTIHLGA